MKKLNITKMCALAILSARSVVGFAIIKEMEQLGGVSSGTLYPILKDMRANGFVVMEKINNRNIVYTITDEGRKEFLLMQGDVNRLIGFVKQCQESVSVSEDVK